MNRRLLGAGLILVQAALACPQAVASQAHAAQIINPPSASVDLSAYTPTSQLPAVVAQAAPVSSVNGNIGAVTVPPPDLSGYASISSLTSPATVSAMAAALSGTFATPAQVSAVQAAIPSVANFITLPQAVAAAPVQSVNGAQGAVTVPGTMRASCVVTTFNASGVGSCTYGGFTGGTAFTTTPDCFAELTATNTSYVYAFPIVSRSQASATVTMSAAVKLLNIALGATTIWTAPPTGTTLTVICRGQ